MADALELAKALAEKARQKETQVKVSKQFIGHFNLVSAHYRCDPDEIAEMKALVRKHPEEAAISYEKMHEEITKTTSAEGINERIKASIEKTRAMDSGLSEGSERPGPTENID